MQLSRVTPLILTYNEEANIGRSLQRLSWAERIVVVDSYSTDDTLRIADEYQQVDIFQREFDHFSHQCNYGLEQIETDWVLSLDADYMVSEEFVDEMCQLPSPPPVDGYTVPFRFCVYGTPLRSTLYPPRTVLYRRSSASYRRDGHAHRVKITGSTRRLDTFIYHDDRKPLRRWIEAQRHYTEDEMGRYRTKSPAELSWPDWFRLYKWSPLLVFFYCLLWKGLILDGKAGVYYALQRTYAELLSVLMIMEEELRTGADEPKKEEEKPPEV
jgi:glycosyltransferase involved in cell wall biosynthesis